jgi:hypothetical protein
LARKIRKTKKGMVQKLQTPGIYQSPKISKKAAGHRVSYLLLNSLLSPDIEFLPLQRIRNSYAGRYTEQCSAKGGGPAYTKQRIDKKFMGIPDFRF